jgi:hypothetical protein
VITDHIVKSKTVANGSPVHLNHIKSIVNLQVEKFPPILIEWLQTKMNWNDIKAEVKLIKGMPIEISDWSIIKINLSSTNKSRQIF